MAKKRMKRVKKRVEPQKVEPNKEESKKVVHKEEITKETPKVKDEVKEESIEPLGNELQVKEPQEPVMDYTESTDQENYSESNTKAEDDNNVEDVGTELVEEVALETKVNPRVNEYVQVESTQGTGNSIPEKSEEEIGKGLVEHTQQDEHFEQVLEENTVVTPAPEVPKNDPTEFGEIKPVEAFQVEGAVTSKEPDYEANMGGILANLEHIESLKEEIDTNFAEVIAKAEELEKENADLGVTGEANEIGDEVQPVNANEGEEDFSTESGEELDEELGEGLEYKDRDDHSEDEEVGDAESGELYTGGETTSNEERVYSLEEILAEETYKTNNPRVQEDAGVSEGTEGELEEPIREIVSPEAEEDKPKEVVSMVMKELLRQKLELSEEEEAKQQEAVNERKKRISVESGLLENITTDLSDILPYGSGKRLEEELNGKAEELKRIMQGKVEEEQKEQERKDRESMELRAEYAQMTEEKMKKSNKKGLFGRKRGG